MKTMFLGILIFPLKILLSQTAYSTSFNAGHGWSLNVYNNLNTNSANEGDAPNIWYVSDNESNKGVGNRGGANCGNPTLHIGSTTVGDLGAAYDAGGCTNLGFGPCAFCLGNGLYCVTSDRSAVSPNISTVGYSSLNFSFLYIHWGTALLDNGEIIYSTNGGVTWIKLADVPKSGCCSGGASCLTGCTNNATCSSTHQGKWQSYSAAVPAAGLGISNFRVGFRWFNDDVSTSGRDPSIAVDDILLNNPVLPVKLIGFETISNDDNIEIMWSTMSQVNFDSFVLERSMDGIGFGEIMEMKAGVSDNESRMNYSFTDNEIEGNKIYYYRLKCVDKDKSFSLSAIKTGMSRSNTNDIICYYTNETIVVKNNLPGYNFNKINVFDIAGHKVLTADFNSGVESNKFNVSNLNKGMYFVRLSNFTESKTIKIIIW